MVEAKLSRYGSNINIFNLLKPDNFLINEHITNITLVFASAFIYIPPLSYYDFVQYFLSPF